MACTRRTILAQAQFARGPEATNQWTTMQVGTRAEAARVARNLTSAPPTDFQRELTALQERGLAAACSEFPALARFQVSIAEQAV